jgi:hypothetical protein
VLADAYSLFTFMAGQALAGSRRFLLAETQVYPLEWKVINVGLDRQISRELFVRSRGRTVAMAAIALFDSLGVGSLDSFLMAYFMSLSQVFILYY